MARRRAEVLAPEDRGSIEDQVILGTRINRGSPVLWSGPALPRGPLGHDLQPRQVGRWVTVVFPADQAWDAVALLHPGALKEPMLRLDDRPVATAVDRLDIARANQVTLIGAA